MPQTAQKLDYADRTTAEANAIRATRFVAWVGVIVGLTGLIWTGMMWRMHRLDGEFGLWNLVQSLKPQVMPFEVAMILHLSVEGVLALALLGGSLAHLVAPRSIGPVYAMRLYAIALFAYALVLAALFFIVRRERFWNYDEEALIRLASVWIPRQVHELVYAVFVLFFMRVPCQGVGSRRHLQ
jgi:hypothetical protein